MFVQGAVRVKFIRARGTNESAVVLGSVGGQLRRRAARVVAKDAFKTFDIGMMRASNVLSIMRYFPKGRRASGRLTDPHPVDLVNGTLMILKRVLSL